MTRPRLFQSIGETAADLGVDPMTIYRAVWAGEFPALKVRGRWRIPIEAVTRMLADALRTSSAADAADYTAEEAS